MRKTARLGVAALASLGLVATASPSQSAQGADGTGFTTVDTLVDRDGTTHVRQDRTYRGLRVLGGDRVVHSKAGRSLGVSGTFAGSLGLSTTASVSAGDARERAVAPRAATRGIAGQKVREAPELVIDATGAAPRLAWEVVSHGVQSDGTPSRLATYVDAQSGAVIRSVQQIHTADGSGQSLYSGPVPLQLTLSNGTYSMKDPTRGNTWTGDTKNGTDLALFCPLFGLGCAAATIFSGADASFGNGTSSSRESAGVDAQYGTNVTWDYFKNVHGRNGIFGDGRGSHNRVHYGSNYVNAFWDGSKMTYGDGDGVSYGPLVSLDVAGHEMSHGVTQNSANLTYSGESGGLNESTSDIFGSLVEFHAANSYDPGDYYIGEAFDLAQHDGFRRMDDPDSDGKSVNCWSSGVGNLDVHYSSGVGNHFFYLLSEGSGSKTIGGLPHSSTTCNNSTVTGIGRDAAGKIWYRALTVYMTSSTNYAGARVASVKAANDIYGAGSQQAAAVAAAWSAVSVN